MKVIEKNTIKAIQELYSGKRTNPVWRQGDMTAIRAIDNYTQKHVITVYLHGNAIIRLDCDTGVIEASLAGWDTVTTRSRLNSIIWGLDSLSFTRFWRKRGVTYTHINSEDVEADHHAWYTVGAFDTLN